MHGRIIFKWMLAALLLIQFAAFAVAQEFTPLGPVLGNTDSVRTRLLPGITASIEDPFRVLRHTDTVSDYYLGSGAAGDTFATYFQPGAPCSLLYLANEFYTAGNVQAFVWAPSPEWLAMFPSGKSMDRNGQYLSPIGNQLAGPYNVVTTEWSWFDLIPEGDISLFFGEPGNPRVDAGDADWRDGFLVGWVKDGTSPYPLADDVKPRGFNYSWFGGPWTADSSGAVQWGWYNLIIEYMQDVGIRYTNDYPAVIEDITQPPNTVDTAGLIRIEASIHDNLGWSTPGDRAVLHMEFCHYVALTDTTDTTYVKHSVTEMHPINREQTRFAGTISMKNRGLVAGDWVNYWISVEDESGRQSSTIEEKRNFDVIGLKSPRANVLWIDDGQFKMTQLNFYERGLIYNYDPADDVIEVYKADANNGFDKALIDARRWDLVLFTADGSDFMPMIEPLATTPFANYLTSTDGALMYFDQDYFYAHDHDSDNLQFFPGEFAYDVLGIASGMNDPDPDSLFEGEGSDNLSAEFSSDPFELTYTHDAAGTRMNWSDYLTTTGSAADWFYGYNDANTYGSVTPTPGGGNVYYLSFDPTLATNNGDDPDPSGNAQFWHFYTELFNMSGTVVWQSAVEVASVQPLRWSLAPAYPNPFNPSTTLSYTVPQAGPVTLEVFDITGRHVSTLQSGVATAGTHRATFDGHGLASGIYLVRMRSEGFSAVQRMVLLK